MVYAPTTITSEIGVAFDPCKAQPVGERRKPVAKRAMNGKTDPPTAVELALACLMVTLEERDPGLCDRWVQHAESDALHAEIRRLHTQAPNPDLVANLQEAMALARSIRFVVKAHVRPEARRKRRER